MVSITNTHCRTEKRVLYFQSIRTFASLQPKLMCEFSLDGV